jgi:transposase
VDKNGRLEWAVDNELVEKEKALDGCYIVRTDVHAGKMDKDEAVRSYKALTGVEKAFRNLKTVSLEIRPVYHKKDDRIRAHVFLCMLAYYIQWHATEYRTLTRQIRCNPLIIRELSAIFSFKLLAT